METNAKNTNLVIVNVNENQEKKPRKCRSEDRKEIMRTSKVLKTGTFWETSGQRRKISEEEKQE